MKRAIQLFAFALLITAYFPVNAGPRGGLWKDVDDAVKKGLPKTAITNLEPIITGAMHDKAYAEATKAIAKKIALEGVIEGNRPEEKIVRLEAQITNAPPEIVPVLDTILAHWYWQYFQRNRWRFMERTATAQAPGNDFTTWDLARLFAEIDKRFQKALSAEAMLKATPISAWDDLIEKGTMPDSTRPTLYDFIAHEALEFYTSGEQAGAKREDVFEVSADDPVFDSAGKFLAWKPDTTESDSPKLRAIQLYQALLRFHQDDPQPKIAFADLDLERLVWASNVAFGEGKNDRYTVALEQFIQTYAGLEVSSLACERLARAYQQQGDLLKAHQTASRGQERFPKSPGGKLCHNLIIEIESKSATITTERVWNAPWPNIFVRYRNIEAIYFRAIPANWEMFLERRHSRPESLTDAEQKEILRKPAALKWSTPLPKTSDFKERIFEAPAPTTLPPGFYFIVASGDPTFGEKDNVVSMAPVWISDMALVTRTRDGRIEGFVLNAESGEPISGAEVSIWHLNNQGNRISDPTLQTDTNGFFSMKPAANVGFLFRARHHGQSIATANDIQSYDWMRRDELKPAAQTVFFTDRAIYRPGQTIQYKGICLWVDQEKDNYEVLKDEELTVVFHDPNGKEIGRQKQRANDYGSFAGSFTAPRDRLMGSMFLSVEGRAQGSAHFRVEEYKRPKFEVTLDAPKTAAKLNEKVNLTGHAMSYTGATVDGAEIKYRIVREVQMPWWWGWWERGPRGGSQEIAHGTAKTEPDGSFKVEFTALPDRSVPEKDEPTFIFRVNADVTDSAGETRSADKTIRVGYVALEAKLSAEDWQVADKPVDLTVETKTLDGEPQPAKGVVKIYSLKAPAKVHRATLGNNAIPYPRPVDVEDGSDGTNDLSKPINWPLDKVVAEKNFTTGTNGEAKLAFTLPVGAFRALLETRDRFGKSVTGKLPIQVLNPGATKLAIRIPHVFTASKWESTPGKTFTVLWGTGYEAGRAFVEIEHRGQMIQRFWTKPGQTQQQIAFAVTEAMRGGFTVHVTQICENRAYLDSQRVDVPWDNKDLTLRWEHFTSKLQPGQKETWTAVISGPKAEHAVAEMIATLYDESLDAFVPHNWPERFSVFRNDASSAQAEFANFNVSFNQARGEWNMDGLSDVEITYRHFPADLIQERWSNRYWGVRRERVMTLGAAGGDLVGGGGPAMAMTPLPAEMDKTVTNGLETRGGRGAMPGYDPYFARIQQETAQAKQLEKRDLSQVTVRKNLNETAFFFPQLVSDSNGVVSMTFAMPEALTKWRFMSFAHDRSLRSGNLEAHAVTAKDLMIQPNPPRFLREGDTVEFTVKVLNQSDASQSGTVRLNFTFAQNEQNADAVLGNAQPDQAFDIPSKQSRSFAWRIRVPDGCGFLTYKVVGATAKLSDGEEGAVPVLSRRILVTESLPLPIRGPATNRFEFTKLLQSADSTTSQNQSLTVQMVSNPAWYAVLALPYLMEFPYECSEQTFNRLYANALARHIANSDPKIRRVFDQWKNTPALDSPLEKNQDLKAVMLEETPWLRDAQKEGEGRRNVGVLFDDNRLEYETQRVTQKLFEMQLHDGRWPWFPGGQGNDYITLYIVSGFGRLRHLGVSAEMVPTLRAIPALDTWMTENYRRIQKWDHPEDYVPSSTDALYLYARSFFLTDHPVAPPHKTAIDFYLKQSRKFWLQTNCRQTQGQLALALKRWGGDENLATARAIMNSLKERSVSNAEMGMFWRDTELSWWWYHAPIETQALMIEAFDEVMNDQQAVEDCRVWLLKQKQTQNWKTTKATADAVYALLLRGVNILSSDALVQVSLGGMDVTPGIDEHSTQKVEPGTGFYEQRFSAPEIKPELGEIAVRKVDSGVAWGSVHWQYLEDMSKVTPHEGTPLKLKKALFIKSNTAQGPVLSPLGNEVHVGDELVVRIELRADRDMEYVHLKDQRGSGTEPVNVLSRYKYQDGLAYYESTRDTASHFFIDYLPKGVYVFGYSTRIQLRGEYQTGVAEIQCMYAPEFNSHSESLPLVVK